MTERAQIRGSTQSESSLFVLFLKFPDKTRILKSFEAATDVHLYSHDNALILLERRLVVK